MIYVRAEGLGRLKRELVTSLWSVCQKVWLTDHEIHHLFQAFHSQTKQSDSGSLTIWWAIRSWGGVPARSHHPRGPSLIWAPSYVSSWASMRLHHSHPSLVCHHLSTDPRTPRHLIHLQSTHIHYHPDPPHHYTSLHSTGCDWGCQCSWNCRTVPHYMLAKVLENLQDLRYGCHICFVLPRYKNIVL